MTEKIRLLSGAEIRIGGYGIIEIHEDSDGTFNIEISESAINHIRIGFRDKWGIEYNYLATVVELLKLAKERLGRS